MGPFDAGWLATSVQLAAPLVYAAIGELISERAGILNIGLEGYILSGAFFAFLGAWLAGSLAVGVAVGMAAGAALAACMALLSIHTHADQVVVGVGLNVLALGVTTFAYREIFLTRSDVLLPVP